MNAYRILSRSFLFILLPILITACNSIPPKSDNGNVGTITLKVGESATCYTVGSCTVYLVMPLGKGEYTVKQDGPDGQWTAGTYSADGQTVLLGQFYTGRTKFTIEGMDSPDTWVTVLGDD